MKVKIYSTNKETVQKFADDLGKKLDFINEGSGEGYCTSGNTIRVFTKFSAVDTSDDWEDVTPKYTGK